LAPLPVCCPGIEENLLNEPAVSRTAIPQSSSYYASHYTDCAIVVTPFRFNLPLLNENMRNGKEERFLKKTAMLYLEALYSHPPGRTAEKNICSIQGKPYYHQNYPFLLT
jgi:hypothetical protein